MQPVYTLAHYFRCGPHSEESQTTGCEIAIIYLSTIHSRISLACVVTRMILRLIEYDGLVIFRQCIALMAASSILSFSILQYI